MTSSKKDLTEKLLDLHFLLFEVIENLQKIIKKLLTKDNGYKSTIEFTPITDI